MERTRSNCTSERVGYSITLTAATVYGVPCKPGALIPSKKHRLKNLNLTDSTPIDVPIPTHTDAPARNQRIRHRATRRRGGGSGHEIGLGEASKADVWCNLRCETSPVDLTWFPTLLWPPRGRTSTIVGTSLTGRAIWFLKSEDHRKVCSLL